MAHAEIVLPSAVADRVDMEWALDRSRLWNAAEHSGRQWNPRMARVPPELAPAQRTQLVRGFARELADRYGGAVDFAVHADSILLTTRHTHCAWPPCGGMVIGRPIATSFSNVFQVLPHTLGLGPDVWRVLDKCHSVRNLGEYEGDLNIDERLVADLITACRSVAAKTGFARANFGSIGDIRGTRMPQESSRLLDSDAT